MRLIGRVNHLRCAACLTGILWTVMHSDARTFANEIPPRYQVRMDRNVRIPMRDGKSLSANLTRPDVPESERLPILIEYHPYRKDDVSWSGHDGHWYLAERGFICVRLDVRGTGGSDGVNTDEYVPQEQTDGYDAVEWLAQQPYSNGCVGMFGTSYGGFTAVQVAMNRQCHVADVRRIEVSQKTARGTVGPPAAEYVHARPAHQSSR
jgi:predicted acyl esterase